MPTSPFSITGERVPSGAAVMGFRGREAISRPYEYEVLLSVPEGALSAADLRAALHTRATLALRREDGDARRVVHGVVTAAAFVRTLPGGASLVRVTLGPALSRLAHARRNRVWVQRSVPAVVSEVLRECGLGERDFELRLETPAAYAPVEHLCQYRESSLDFVSRRLEAEGIYYYFEHPEGGASEVMVLSDSRSFLTPLTQEGVRFVPVGDDDTSAVEGLRAFEYECSAVPDGARARGSDYLHPALDVSGASLRAADSAFVTHDLESSRDPRDAARHARVCHEAALARESVVRGEGRCYELSAGHTFDFEEHPVLSGEYLATSVTLEGFDVAAHPALAPRLGFRGEVLFAAVEAIPAAVQFRPERVTPAPAVSGHELGVVRGAAAGSDPGRYAHLDAQGRYLVQLRFDDGGPKAAPSVRMRMAQPHAGAGGAGLHMPLRDGTEVLVGFLRGDPDLPYIAAAVPDALTPPPVTEENATKSVLQTGGGNRITLEDLQGREYIKLSTPYKNATFHLGAPHNPQYDFELVTAGRGLIRTGKVGATTELETEAPVDDAADLGVNEQGLGIQVGGNLRERVQGNLHVDIRGDRDEVIGGADKTEHTGNNSEEYFLGHRSEMFGGSQEEIYIGSKLEIAAGLRVELALVAALSIHGGLSLETFLGASADICLGPRYERSRLTIQDEEAMRVVRSRLTAHDHLLEIHSSNLQLLMSKLHIYA